MVEQSRLGSQLLRGDNVDVGRSGILVLLGVGGASTALSIGYRKPYFLAIGIVVLGYGFYRLYRKSCQTKHLDQKQKLFIFSGAFLVTVLLYYLLTFVVAPLVAPLVYQLRLGS